MNFAELSWTHQASKVTLTFTWESIKKEELWVSESSVHEGKSPSVLWRLSHYGAHHLWVWKACEQRARVTPGLMSVTYRGWNLSVTLWPAITPNTSHLPTPTTLSPHHQPLLPWVGTDVWILRRSHSGALIGPIGLNKGWHTAWRAPGQREAARTPIICLIVWGRYRGATANLRTVTWANEIIV